MKRKSYAKGTNRKREGFENPLMEAAKEDFSRRKKKAGRGRDLKTRPLQEKLRKGGVLRGREQFGREKAHIGVFQKTSQAPGS